MYINCIFSVKNFKTRQSGILKLKMVVYSSRTRRQVEPVLRWFKLPQRCTNVKLGQPLLNQGSGAIKPPLDDNMHFRPNQTRSREHTRVGGQVESTRH